MDKDKQLHFYTESTYQVSVHHEFFLCHTSCTIQEGIVRLEQ